MRRSRLMAAIPEDDAGTSGGARTGMFARLLADDRWLPEQYAVPHPESGMGGGIGQYALYRAEDGSLCLFSLVVPAGAATPVHDHLAWGLVGIYRGRQDETVYRRLDGRSGIRGAQTSEISQAADAVGRAVLFAAPRRLTTFTTSRPCRTRRRSRFTCSRTTPRACGATSSSQHRAASRCSGPATPTAPCPPQGGVGLRRPHSLRLVSGAWLRDSLNRQRDAHLVADEEPAGLERGVPRQAEVLAVE